MYYGSRVAPHMAQPSLTHLPPGTVICLHFGTLTWLEAERILRQGFEYKSFVWITLPGTVGKGEGSVRQGRQDKRQSRCRQASLHHRPGPLWEPVHSLLHPIIPPKGTLHTSSRQSTFLSQHFQPPLSSARAPQGGDTRAGRSKSHGGSQYWVLTVSMSKPKVSLLDIKL